MAVWWFVLLSLCTLAAWGLGLWVGRGGRRRRVAGLATALVGLFGWAALMQYPALAVRVIPAAELSYMEGTAATPWFMVVIGTAWATARLRREKHAAVLGAALGVVYFISGGGWMLQSSPAAVLGNTIQPQGDYLQSQDYSCVAAASATALARLGVTTTEADMAELTQTRAGSGSTLIRALHGINQRLRESPWEARLVARRYDELRTLPMPALAPLRYEWTRRHMVVILAVREDGLEIMDPMVGEYFAYRDQIEAVFTGEVLVFTHRGAPVATVSMR